MQGINSEDSRSLHSKHFVQIDLLQYTGECVGVRVWVLLFSSAVHSFQWCLMTHR